MWYDLLISPPTSLWPPCTDSQRNVSFGQVLLFKNTPIFTGSTVCWRITRYGFECTVLHFYGKQLIRNGKSNFVLNFRDFCNNILPLCCNSIQWRTQCCYQCRSNFLYHICKIANPPELCLCANGLEVWKWRQTVGVTECISYHVLGLGKISLALRCKLKGCSTKAHFIFKECPVAPLPQGCTALSCLVCCWHDIQHRSPK